MRVVITSTFPVRDKPITSYYSFPVYSDEIEKRMSKQLDFLKQYPQFSLTMSILQES